MGKEITCKDFGYSYFILTSLKALDFFNMKLNRVWKPYISFNTLMTDTKQ